MELSLKFPQNVENSIFGRALNDPVNRLILQLDLEGIKKLPS